jgi:DNA-binding CsgD family transcriptional regulator
VIFELLGEGLKTRDIAAQLGVSVKTVESHRENIKVKLGLNSAEQLIAAAARCSSGAVAVPLLP